MILMVNTGFVYNW